MESAGFLSSSTYKSNFVIWTVSGVCMAVEVGKKFSAFTEYRVYYCQLIDNITN
jgi:hypothetical protein